ncbi:uncharacterized protein PV06_00397 [Exophiala oligosperma]|uniref:Uncharacterized protein n=1 Tax=Exophiala oligosperma TaxID=215243 RepID=A0A0D2CCT5_9EURO|nr:uncharacterized protein PV06_00397 [Exophiala oligosperma]KIW47732.1 hypothetical protein PV06_00397 [Exophiala oligosperma]
MPELDDASALRDKTVIITGGASGLGLATATHFARAGAYVTIADIQDAPGEHITHALRLEGCHVSYTHCDVTDWLSSVLAFKHAASFGPSKTLHVAGLFAGVEGDRESLVDQVLAAHAPSLSPGDIPTRPRGSAIRVDLGGVYKSSWLALYYMRLRSKVPSAESFSKSLILVSSLAGYSDMPGNTDYNAAKFGVRGIFRGLRHTTSSMNVRVNLVAPFWIDTPLVHTKLVEMASLGITPGSGFSFASVNDCVNVATTFATDATISGRAYAVVPEGFVDIDDEESSGWAGEILKEEWKKRTRTSEREL